MNRSVLFISLSILTETLEIFKKGKINLIVGFIPNFDPSNREVKLEWAYNKFPTDNEI